MSAQHNPEERADGRSSQARCLTELLANHGLSAREIARRSAVIAKELHQPDLKVGHQAVSSWANGMRHPRGKHQQVLAMILGVPLTDISVACDQKAQTEPKYAFREITVVVPGSIRPYRYALPIRIDINLKEPAIYTNWSGMFSVPPSQLQTHLKGVRSQCFGWIPDALATPMVHYSHCLVPIERVSNRKALKVVDSVESSQRRVWFVYLPGGRLEVGIGYRIRRTFVLTRNNGNRLIAQEFPLASVELIGHFRGNVVFYVPPANTNGTGGPNGNQNGVVQEVPH